jgi:DNA-binding NarL/FixJ family response regulator
MTLLGRRAECEGLDGLLADIRNGHSRVLVVRGEAGAGKTALLGYLSSRAEGFRIITAVGVESEMELAYSGLHQLCGPMLDLLDRLPPPQHDALATVFGLGESPAPDRFLVALATLSLFAETADKQPLLCIVEDAQWMDQASMQVLAFVARRLLAERVSILAATRTGIGDGVLAGMPELSVGPLGENDARALLLQNLVGPLDAIVCDRIVAESHGNPLALLELPRAWTAAELAGGFGVPESGTIAGKIEDSYVRRLRRLSPDTQILVLAATAEPLGDPVLLQTAAKILDIDMTAIDGAVDEGLLTVGRRVEFAHPLVRSSAYRAAPTEDRHRVHRALADATDPASDPDRRAWHRARGASGPDEEVATDLERSAGRAQARGGVAAAAAFLQRSVELTVDHGRRTERALAAAEANFRAGAFTACLQLTATAEAGPLDEFQRARAELLRGDVAFATGNIGDAPALLLDAARRFEAVDLERARGTYLSAWGAAFVAAAHLAGSDLFLEIRRSVQALPQSPDGPRALDLLLDGLAILSTEGHGAATPTLQRAGKALIDIPVRDVLAWGWMATAANNTVWDNDGALAISARQVQLLRDVGALAQLPLHLSALGLATAWVGDFPAAESIISEADGVAGATGSPPAPWTELRLRSLQGREREASEAIARAVEQAAAGGQVFATYADWAAAVLYNGLGRYEEAVAAARRATSETFEFWVSVWALPELIEAASRAGEVELARDALERLVETTQAARNDPALGFEARCRALLTDGPVAEELYRQAIDRLARTKLRPEVARAHLLYGEWLRRAGRRVDARAELRTAYDEFISIGMDAFAERTRRELKATGEKVRKRSAETRDELTPQEEQIARLARDGFSNPEIGAQLFISARTVEWHLRKVFTKLDISSRRQLRTSMPH